MPRDLIAELALIQISQALIQISQAQREAWLRWIPIMEAAGISDAEIGAVCSDLLAPDLTEEVRHAA